MRGSGGGHRGARQDGGAIGAPPGRTRTRGIKIQGQHNLRIVRCRRRPLVECALVVYLRDPSFEVHGLLPHRYAKVPPRAIGRGCHCAPETQLTPAASRSNDYISSGIAERVALTSATRGVVVCRIGLVLLRKGAEGGERRAATRRAGGITGAPHQVFKDGGSMAPGAAPVVAGVLATPHRASPGSSSGESWVAPPPARPLHLAGGRTGARTA